MLRRGALLGAFLCIVAVAGAADTPPAFKDGNWRLGYGPGMIGESPIFILKVETKEGKAGATKLAAAPNAPFELVSFELKGDVASIKLKIGDRPLAFTGKMQADGKSFRGEFGDDKLLTRGYFSATDADTIVPADIQASQPKPPESFTNASKIANGAAQLRFKARQAKDVEEKADLLKQAAAAQEKADKEAPDAWKAVIAADKKNPFAVMAASNLIQSAARTKADPKEVATWVALVESEAAAFGPRLAENATLGVVDTLGSEKAYAELVLASFEKVYSKLSDKDPLARQSKILKSATKLFASAGKADLAKTATAKYAAVETALDKEYTATVPPFKVTKQESPKPGESHAVLMELFTGAQCPPCVAADVAFDALSKAYDHKDVILLQYHMHIPGPDPLTNTDTVARFGYYGELFTGQVRGTPTTLFNGKIAAGGGGGMEGSEGKFKDYAKAIATSATGKSDVVITGKVNRAGDILAVDVSADGVKEPKGLKLRVVLTEDSIKYVGGNALRFHHHVVRHFAGGTAGTEIKDAKTTKNLSIDLNAVQAELKKYQDTYAKNEKITYANDAPVLDKTGLKVVVFVQNDATGEVLNAIQLDVPAK